MLRYRKYRLKGKYKVLFILFLSIVITTFIFYKIDKDIKPLLFSVSESEVRILATESINQVVKDELSNNVKCSDFVNIKTDNDGNVTSIEMDTVEMNKFGSSVALKVQDKMKFIGGRGVSIPLGVVTGSSILSFYGPKINVKIMPLGNIMTNFKSEIQSAGINQSRYRVYITVDTNIQIMIPPGQDKIAVSSTIPIAETVIVGKVPESYFNTESGDSNSPNIVPIPTK